MRNDTDANWGKKKKIFSLVSRGWDDWHRQRLGIADEISQEKRKLSRQTETIFLRCITGSNLILSDTFIFFPTLIYFVSGRIVMKRRKKIELNKKNQRSKIGYKGKKKNSSFEKGENTPITLEFASFLSNFACALILHGVLSNYSKLLRQVRTLKRLN